MWIVGIMPKKFNNIISASFTIHMHEYDLASKWIPKYFNLY
jgi:hypothetical protein